MASEKDLQQVRQIVLEQLRDLPVRVFLFGSHATGRAVAASDIDIAVLPEGKVPAGLLSRIREELEESMVPYMVDLVDLSQTDNTFRQRVLVEGIEWNV